MLEERSSGYAVVDLKLGGASGLACVELLHAHDPEMLIVVLTGFASIATAVEAIKLGACHYLAKPSNTDDIEAAFDKAEGNAEVALDARPTSIKTLEWERIHQTLIETDFNISEAARRLGHAPADAGAEAREAAGEVSLDDAVASLPTSERNHVWMGIDSPCDRRQRDQASGASPRTGRVVMVSGKYPRVGRQHHDAARPRNHRDRVDDVVHFAIGLEVDSGPAEIIQNYTANRGSGLDGRWKSRPDLLGRRRGLAMPADGRSERRRPADRCARAGRPDLPCAPPTG